MKSTHHNIVNDIFIGFYSYDQWFRENIEYYSYGAKCDFYKPWHCESMVALTEVRRWGWIVGRCGREGGLWFLHLTMENQKIQFKVNGKLYGRLAISFKVMKLSSRRTKSNITNKTWWGGKGENII